MMVCLGIQRPSVARTAGYVKASWHRDSGGASCGSRKRMADNGKLAIRDATDSTESICWFPEERKLGRLWATTCSNELLFHQLNGS